jgi:DNA-binding XRE family transcriptional regulator
MMRRTDHRVDRRIGLADVDDSGNTALRVWRRGCLITVESMAAALGVSVATYYRIEGGGMPPSSIALANKICSLSNGRVRYGDLFIDFDKRFA